MNMMNASMTEFALKYGCNPNQSPARVLYDERRRAAVCRC